MSKNLHIGVCTDSQWRSFDSFPLPADLNRVEKSVSDYFDCVRRRSDVDLFIAFDEHMGPQSHALKISADEVKSLINSRSNKHNFAVTVHALALKQS